MLQIQQLKMLPEHTGGQLRKKAAAVLGIRESEILSFSVVRRSIDARRKPEIFYRYAVNVEVGNEERILSRRKGSQVRAVQPVGYRFPYRKEGPVACQPLRPVIVGTGPAGLFCGYFLALHGYRPILLEQGEDVDARRRTVETFWKEGKLNPLSNVSFGEGGAGTFSDGKLHTLVKDPEGRNRAVLETFVAFGAKEEILYDAKPHIGTDVLCGIVKRIREEIRRLGGEVRFASKMTGLLTEEPPGSPAGALAVWPPEKRSANFSGPPGTVPGTRVAGVVVNGREILPCSQLVLAIGHSARDTFSMLYEKGIPMEAKAFAVGLRAEHSQKMINRSQYAGEDPGSLGPAAYQVAARTASGRGVYSFCMCPGGYVVNASTEEGRLAVNGMSYSRRDGRNANSAVIVTVTPEDFGSAHPLAGIAFQRSLEEKAYALGRGRIPVQRYGDFRRGVEAAALERPALSCRRRGESCGAGSVGREEPKTPPEPELRAPEPELPPEPELRAPEPGVPPEPELRPEPATKGDFVYADLSALLPPECSRALVEGMEQFGKQISGFSSPQTLLSGVESRTSSPVRVIRGADMQSALKGLYPCGEGAGYAGGITSAAMDGIRAAEAVASQAEDPPG
ncbi:MAG: NAD(P)-binding protein [Clostridium sp.]|jgi:uncharacterized FAD-dependent dehydrogenase|nr:NAD(P)-binding protein [Clostridium sp.]